MIQVIGHCWNVRTVVIDKRWVVIQDDGSWKDVIIKLRRDRINEGFSWCDGTDLYLDCGAVIQIYNSVIFRIVYTNTKEKKE